MVQPRAAPSPTAPSPTAPPATAGGSAFLWRFAVIDPASRCDSVEMGRGIECAELVRGVFLLPESRRAL